MTNISEYNEVVEFMHIVEEVLLEELEDKKVKNILSNIAVRNFNKVRERETKG